MLYTYNYLKLYSLKRRQMFQRAVLGSDTGSAAVFVVEDLEESMRAACGGGYDCTLSRGFEAVMATAGGCLSPHLGMGEGCRRAVNGMMHESACELGGQACPGPR